MAIGMTHQQFSNWLDKLKTAWLGKNPQAAVDLCADTFIWHETPFSQVITTKEQLLKEWESILNQENVSVTLEILSVIESVGIAKWNAKFTLISTKRTLAYEGIYLVKLNDEGKCIEFREWFNIKEQ